MGPSHYSQAKEQFATVLESRVQVGQKKGKGKVSMQNVVVLQANAASEFCNPHIGFTPAKPSRS